MTCPKTYRLYGQISGVTSAFGTPTKGAARLVFLINNPRAQKRNLRIYGQISGVTSALVGARPPQKCSVLGPLTRARVPGAGDATPKRGSAFRRTLHAPRPGRRRNRADFLSPNLHCRLKSKPQNARRNPTMPNRRGRANARETGSSCDLSGDNELPALLEEFETLQRRRAADKERLDKIKQHCRSAGSASRAN
jgi:hypothetical protein